LSSTKTCLAPVTQSPTLGGHYKIFQKFLLTRRVFGRSFKLSASRDRFL
jgi:hypothetical protein